MGLFKFGKKNNEEEQEHCDCCCKNCHSETELEDESKNTSDKRVKILGSGCAKCNALEKETVEALKELHMDTTVEHVTDFTKIAAYGVMSTPALVIDGKVISFGKVLKKNEVIDILKGVANTINKYK